jgi:hypothetical protein
MTSGDPLGLQQVDFRDCLGLVSLDGHWVVSDPACYGIVPTVMVLSVFWYDWKYVGGTPHPYLEPPKQNDKATRE